MFRRAPKPVRIEVFGKTDLGKTRDHNEDCFLVADLTREEASLQSSVRDHVVGPHGTVFVVADGMGGAAAGELASEMATETIYSQLVRAWGGEREVTPQRFAYRLKEAVEVANSRIHAHAKAHPEVRGMGTTTTAVGVLGDHVYLAQVGDSRAYLIRGGRAYQLTKDQSLMQRLVEAGELTEEEAAQSERRDNITVIIARFDGDGLRPAGRDDEVGHQLYPLIDTETSTEPVPVYRGSPPPVPNRQVRWRMVAAAVVAAALVAAAVYLVSRSP